jgi:hypothetical protein
VVSKNKTLRNLPNIKNFSKKPIASLFAMALGMLIILVASVTLAMLMQMRSFMLVFFQTAVTCFYIIFKTMASTAILEKIIKSQQVIGVVDKFIEAYVNDTGILSISLALPR